MKYNKFSFKAGIYDKYRPKYSKEFIDYVCENYDLDYTTVVADIGAGTGILSEEFAQRNMSVICVEPDNNMMEYAKKRLQLYRNVSFVLAPAENTGIDNLSVNLVTVGQAFHWFDKSKFRDECRRILKSEGEVVLVWNVTNSQDPISISLSNLNRSLLKGYNQYNDRDQSFENEYTGFFNNGEVDCRNFNNDLFLSCDEFIGRCLSRSYSPNDCDDVYAKYISSLNEIFNEYSVQGRIKVLNTTKCVIGRVK